jgi:hypothetical protein
MEKTKLEGVTNLNLATFGIRYFHHGIAYFEYYIRPTLLAGAWFGFAFVPVQFLGLFANLGVRGRLATRRSRVLPCCSRSCLAVFGLLRCSRFLQSLSDFCLASL